MLKYKNEILQDHYVFEGPSVKVPFCASSVSIRMNYFNHHYRA